MTTSEGEPEREFGENWQPVHALVFDLGAGSGRAMLARLANGRLSLEEIDRFGDLAIRDEDGLRWDLDALLRHVDEGLRKASRLVGPVHSIGVDSWGLDYALLDRDAQPVARPYHYRNERSLRGAGACPLSRERLFAVTGSQILPVNTVFQLYDEIAAHPQRFGDGTQLLMMADLVSHHLTGNRRNEVTLARTSGLLHRDGRAWSREITDALGMPASMFGPLIQPGEVYGRLRPRIAAALGWEAVPVIAVAAHDTASAVLGLPLEDDDAFVVAGSWSLAGVETERPDVGGAVLEHGFGNEGGVAGRGFLVRSLNGLHLIDGLRRSWERRTGVAPDFGDIARLAAQAPPAQVPAVDTADAAFFNPSDVAAAVQAFHARRGEAAVTDLGEMALAIYKGLACDLASAFRFLETRRGGAFARIRLGGGGARDATFCAVLAEVLGRPVVAGPVEASAWGNAVMQLVGLGRLTSPAQGRRLVAASATFREYCPTERAIAIPLDDA